MIIDARGLDDALNKTVDHAIERCTAVVVRRNGQGTPLAGGTVLRRPDGRSVWVIRERETSV